MGAQVSAFRVVLELVLPEGASGEHAQALLEAAFDDVFESLAIAPEHVPGFEDLCKDGELPEDGFGSAQVVELEQVSE